MNIVSKYTTILYQYQNSHEMSEHIKSMEIEGWKCSSLRYSSLRARFRKNIQEEKPNEK